MIKGDSYPANYAMFVYNYSQTTADETHFVISSQGGVLPASLTIWGLSMLAWLYTGTLLYLTNHQSTTYKVE